MRKHATDGLYAKGRYGDWVPVESSPKETLAGAYQYLSTKYVADMADVLGKTNEAAELRREAETLAGLFNQRYLNAADNQYKGATQTANLVPLWFGITPETQRPAVLQNIVDNIAAHDNHLTTGFIGAAYLMPVLSTFGQDDLAGTLAVQRTYPSWGYMVDTGATTIWERWNSDKYEELNSGMNSFNHYAFGTVGQWYYEYLVGIRPLEPGFKRILIEPHPGGIESAEGTFHSMHGPIRCAWNVTPKLALTVSIPANTTAVIRTPVPCDGEVGPGGKKVIDPSGNTTFEVGAGIYTFAASTEGQ
jgi:alpha-L-rhamnosidase